MGHMVGVMLIMGRLGWVIFYLGLIGLGNGLHVLGNGPHFKRKSVVRFFECKNFEL